MRQTKLNTANNAGYIELKIGLLLGYKSPKNYYDYEIWTKILKNYKFYV